MMGLVVVGRRLLGADDELAVTAAKAVFKAARLGKVDVSVTFVIDTLFGPVVMLICVWVWVIGFAVFFYRTVLR